MNNTYKNQLLRALASDDWTSNDYTLLKSLYIKAEIRKDAVMMELIFKALGRLHKLLNKKSDGSKTNQ